MQSYAALQWRGEHLFVRGGTTTATTHGARARAVRGMHSARGRQAKKHHRCSCFYTPGCCSSPLKRRYALSALVNGSMLRPDGRTDGAVAFGEREQESRDSQRAGRR